MQKHSHLVGKRVIARLANQNHTAIGLLERYGFHELRVVDDNGNGVTIFDVDDVSEYEPTDGVPTSGTSHKVEVSDLPRIYIAGPMSKFKSSGFNFRAFYDAEAKLKNDGYDVVNPARMDNEAGFDENATYSDEEIAKRLREWIPRDIAALATCGHIYMLDGWQESNGSIAEKWVGEKLFKQQVHYQTQPNVCTEAIRLVYGDRGQDYGHPSVEHKRIADYWSVYIADARGLGDSLTEQDVAMMMILLKIARQGHKFKLDNVIDIAGYALCAHRMADRSLP
jgi:hypothetical protein